MANDTVNVRNILTADNALMATYWLFWFAIFALAAQQAGYLLNGRPDWTVSIMTAGVFCAWKAYMTHMADEREARDARTNAMLIRALASRAGMSVHGVSEITYPTADPAMMAIIDDTIGLEEYRRGSLSAYDMARPLYAALPPEMAGKMDLWSDLHKVDRCILRVARRIGNSDRGLLYAIRLLLMQEFVARMSKEHTADRVIEDLIALVPPESPIRRMLSATLIEYQGEDSAGIRIGTWEIVSSWLKKQSPGTFDDLCGDTGRPLPPMPQVLRDALESQPPGKTYTS